MEKIDFETGVQLEERGDFIYVFWEAVPGVRKYPGRKDAVAYNQAIIHELLSSS